ncbi:ABC transporter substrate-binding protein [Brevibacillus fluminis]|uniref:ABC transporter substrate-binding protein n=1 Tax=Brevibacillus fluminis TaxID=511487 RepID=UPI003F896D72
MKRMRSIGLAVGLSCLLLISATGCGNTAQETGQAEPSAPAASKQANGEPKAGGTITMAMPAEPDTLDVQRTNMLSSDTIAMLLGDTLLSQDPETHELKPNLAESYNISEDGLTWTFTLRKGVAFHDGTPLTAKALKATYERALDPKTQAKDARTRLQPLQSIEALDDQTFVMHLKEPSAPLLLNLSNLSFLQPLSSAAIQTFGDQYGRNPVGVGPWKFESWKPGESVTLVRNEAYHSPSPFAKNKGPVRPERLVIKFIKDNQTMMAALDSGSIDIATYVAPKDVKKYKKNDAYTVLEQMRSGLGLFVEMNLRSKPLQDVQVRKALNMAINKEAMVKAILLGEGEVADGPLSPNMFGYDPAIKQYAYHYDAEQAKQLLEAAGWKANGQGIVEKDGQPLSLTLLSSERWSQQSQLVQAMLKEIGVEVKIKNMDFGALLDSASKGEFDLVFMNYTEFDPDFISIFLHSREIGGMNHAAIHNKELDGLLDKGRTTVGKADRQKIYEAVQKLVVEQAYWIPLYISKDFQVVNNRVQGTVYKDVYWNFQDSWVNG